MKIIVTGSLGNVSKPLAQRLVSQGHAVTVISSNPAKQSQIEALGAAAAIGPLEDAEFLHRTFSGADAVYCMIPLSFTEPDLNTYLRSIAENYVQALQRAKVRRVVVLSGWVADLLEGENMETPFEALTDTSLTYLRPGSFYTNFYQSMDLIKKQGILMGVCGGEDRIVFVSPIDVADAAAEELLTYPSTRTIRYVGSEEMTCNEAAGIIGDGIGVPGLKWLLLSEEQMLKELLAAHVPESTARVLVAMQAAMHSGRPLENFHKNNPVMGRVKLADFAREFAVAYNKA
jgi:NAD(P)H dehydrogenase (quinone)